MLNPVKMLKLHPMNTTRKDNGLHRSIIDVTDGRPVAVARHIPTRQVVFAADDDGPIPLFVRRV